MYMEVTVWMVRMELNLTNRANIQTIERTRRDLIIEGIKLSFMVGNLFKEFVNLHISQQIPIKPSHISFLVQLIELMKSIQMTYHKRTSMIAENLNFILQHISQNLQKLLLPIKVIFIQFFYLN